MQCCFVCFCNSLYFLCSLEVVGLFVHLLYARRCLRRVMRWIDRNHPRYFLYEFASQFGLDFFIRQKTPNQPAHASAPPTVRTAQFETQFIPSRQVATYVRGGLWMILLAPQNQPSLRKSYPIITIIILYFIQIRHTDDSPQRVGLPC